MPLVPDSGFHLNCYVMKRRVCQCLVVVLLSCLAANSRVVDEPAPLWKIDLRSLGYKHTFIGRKTTVRFWRNYLVIEQASVPVLAQDPKTHKDAIRTDPAPPSRWVFDIRDHKPVSPEVVANADFEPLPEIAPYPGWKFLEEDHMYVTGRWNKMTITRHTRSGNMYMDEPGRERKTICSGDAQCFYGNMAFVSPQRIARGSQYMAMDGIGKRYARYETSVGGFWPQLSGAMGAQSVESNRASVRVLSAESDKELFSYKWKEKAAETPSTNEPRVQ